MSPDNLANLKLSEFVTRLAAREPTPGGGSAAALAGALAAALGQMVAAYTLGKPKFAHVEPQVRACQERLARVADMLLCLVDEDAVAYGVLDAALKLDRQDASRAQRLPEAATLAAGVPMETATLAVTALHALTELRKFGNPTLRSDVDAAQHLAHAALQAAAANVRANLPLMRPSDAAEIEQQLTELLRFKTSE